MNEENYEVQCNNCGWYGYLEDLTSGESCPDCGGNDEIEDYEGDEEE